MIVCVNLLQTNLKFCNTVNENFLVARNKLVFLRTEKS